jgi:hypothetical protein
LLVQPDGKIFVGGYFTTLAGQTRNCLGRLNADGTLDVDFNAGAINAYVPDVPSYMPYVKALVLQANGKILVGVSVMSN